MIGVKRSQLPNPSQLGGLLPTLASFREHFSESLSSACIQPHFVLPR